MKIKILYIILFLAISNVSKAEHPLKKYCTGPDTAGIIKGKADVCYGATETYSVPTIAFATGYNWKLPSGASIVSGGNTNTIQVRFLATGGTITVEGTNTCSTGVASSFSVTLNSLPKLTLISSSKYCCNDGNISLGSSTFASPTGGTWSCRPNPSYISSNTFLTSNACDNTKSKTYTLIYEYQDPSTTCINKDSTKFTINPLPPLLFVGGTICQDKEKLALKPYIKAPINLNSMVDVQFKLLKTLPKVGGGFCTTNDLIKDEDMSLNYDWWLTVSKSIIDLGTKAKDTLIIEITIQDGAGCYNKDTATFIVVQVPKITFTGFPDLCINAGIINLTKISNAKPEGGCWSVIDEAGYKSKTFLIPGIIGCDSLNTFKISLQNGPGLYRMQYLYSASGCLVQRDTDLRINPLPNVNISISPKGDRGKFCEVDPDVTLNASPAGGAWTSSVSGIIDGNKFKPSLVSFQDRDKWITLTYSYTHSKTKCDTAKSLMVYVQNKPIINIITPDIDTCRRSTMEFKLSAQSQYTSKITWVHSLNPSKAGFENNQQSSNSNPAKFTVKPRSDSATFAFITAFTEAEGSCPFALDTMKIRIDTTACKDSIGNINTHGKKMDYIFIYPNPNHGKFNIKINKPGTYSLKMYAMDGKLVLEKRLQGLETEIINQRFLPGIYNVIIEGPNGEWVKERIIIE